jgi:hypothetical protein
MTLDSQPGKGTGITIDLPLPLSRRSGENVSGGAFLQEINPFRTA